MASGRTKKRGRAGKPAGASEASTDSRGSAEAASARPERRREIRPYIYAGFDLAMAILYAVLLFGVIPNRHGSAQLLAYAMVGSAIAMGVGMLVRSRWGWRISVAGATALLLCAITLLVLILLSAAFLSGVYGAFGRAASMMSLLGAALCIELVGLLPAFQLKFLMTRAGRRYFGQEPLWR